ncbi:MAG: ECF transporter S component [Spirochaetia bacterium]|nr:ECF transporter S component [Spirochaetia bacterium]
MGTNRKNPDHPVRPAYRISSIAILTAVTAVFTLLVRIPIAPTRGYINLGDVAIYFVAFTMGPVSALITAGLGTGLADIIAGYPQWALISFFIHGIQGFTAGAIMRRVITDTPDHLLILPPLRVLAAGLAGSAIMVLFYYLAGAAMAGFGAAAVEIPGNILQNVIGVFGGVLLTKAVLRAYPPVRELYW